MSSRWKFFISWALLFLVSLLVSGLLVWGITAAGLKTQVIREEDLNYSILILSVVAVNAVWFAYLILKNVVDVPPQHNFVYAWMGKPLAPLEPGWHIIFPYFNFLSEPVAVLVCDHILPILTGVRDGLDKDVIEEYTYGTRSNVEPGTGDFVRLMYKVEVRCVDPVKAVYAKEDVYSYLVGAIELEVYKCLKERIKGHGEMSTEDVNDHFVKEDWNACVVSRIKEDMLQETGMEILNLKPVDVINTPEIEKLRRELDDMQYQQKLLDQKLKNVKKEVEISKEEDKKRTNTLKQIIADTGVDGSEALKVILQEKTLATVQESSKNSDFTFMDATGSNKLSDASVLGWGLRSHDRKARSTESEKTESEKTEKKRK